MLDDFDFDSSILNISTDENNDLIDPPSPKNEKKSTKKSTNKSTAKSTKQKKRPAKKSTQKKVEPFDFDKFMDGILEQQNANNDNSISFDIDFNPEQDQKPNKGTIEKNDKKLNFLSIDLEPKISSTPLQSFENNIIYYLNLTTKNLISVFLSELEFNLEEAFNFDHQIHDFLTHLRCDIERIIDEQSAIINNEMKKDRNYLNFDFYFDELTLPYHSTNKSNSSESTKAHSNSMLLDNVDKLINKLQAAKEKMTEISYSKLKEIKSESNQLKNHLIKLNDSTETNRRISKMQYIIDKEEMAIDYYDKMIKDVCQRQRNLRNKISELYHYKNDSYNDENDDENDNEYLKNELLSIIKHFKLNYRAQKKSKISEFYEKIDVGVNSIKNDISVLYKKLRNAEYMNTNKLTNSFYNYNSYQPSIFQDMPIPSDYYFNNQSFTKAPPNLSRESVIVSTVRKQLENIQKISRENNYLLSNIDV